MHRHGLRPAQHDDTVSGTLGSPQPLQNLFALLGNLRTLSNLSVEKVASSQENQWLGIRDWGLGNPKA